MRRPLVAGNWKMNGHVQQVAGLLDALMLEDCSQTMDVCLFPSMVHLAQVIQRSVSSGYRVGAQYFYQPKEGAYTGETALSMLKDLGCQYVLIGHSERREHFAETDAQVASKTLATLAAGLIPVVCVGERLAEREAGEQEAVVCAQMQAVLAALAGDFDARLLFAYEPVWAIGTGKTATPEQAQLMHASMRAYCASAVTPDFAAALRIVYGGSVKAENAGALFEQPDIDGALVGGASLDAEQFLSICRQARAAI